MKERVLVHSGNGVYHIQLQWYKVLGTKTEHCCEEQYKPAIGAGTGQAGLAMAGPFPAKVET